jgi:hypothetical protein
MIDGSSDVDRERAYVESAEARRMDARQARLALFIGVVGLLVWPLSYAWIPNAGHNPGWIGVLVPVAELGAITCALGAIWLGTRSRRAGVTSMAARWAPRVGWLTLGVMAITAFVIAPALYREG